MSVFLEIECAEELADAVLDFDAGAVSEQVLSAFLDLENCPYESSVSITVTDDNAIREINKEMRGIDAATDVLSFPMVQYPEPGAFSVLEEMQADAFDPDSGELLLGDVVISADHVRDQAESYGHSKKREFAFLLTHSLLHLIGYDHMEPQDAELMEERQRIILETCGITRDRN